MSKPRKNKEELETLNEVIQQFVAKHHLQKGLDRVNIEEVWSNEMGPAVKKYTTNILFKRNTLYIQLSSSVLREELSYGKQKIIKMLNEAMGKKIIEHLVLR